MPLNVETFTNGPAATNSFLLYGEDKVALIVDAPPDSFGPLDARIKELGLTPKELVLTHTHWDHTADANYFRDEYGSDLSVSVHRADEYRILDPMSHLVWPIPLEMTPTIPDKYLEEDGSLQFGEIEFKILFAPGHTEGSICLYSDQLGLLMAGDVLFAGSVGRTDLPGGDWDTLMASITNVLMPLPDETRVCPGHGPMTTIGEERYSNPYVELSDNVKRS